MILARPGPARISESTTTTEPSRAPAATARAASLGSSCGTALFDDLVLTSAAGRLVCRRVGQTTFSVDMGEPDLAWDAIPPSRCRLRSEGRRSRSRRRGRRGARPAGRCRHGQSARGLLRRLQRSGRSRRSRLAGSSRRRRFRKRSTCPSRRSAIAAPSRCVSGNAAPGRRSAAASGALRDVGRGRPDRAHRPGRHGRSSRRAVGHRMARRQPRDHDRSSRDRGGDRARRSRPRGMSGLPAGHDPEVVSFGCRLNLVEGEGIRRAAREAGRRDVVIVNSCGVTGEAGAPGPAGDPPSQA